MQAQTNRDPLYDARNGIHVGLTAILAWFAFRLGLLDPVFNSSRTFVYMARLASESTWSILFWATANIGAMGLITNNKLLRLSSVLIVATAHGVLAGCMIMAGASIWSGTFVVIAGMGYYLGYRRARVGI